MEKYYKQIMNLIEDVENIEDVEEDVRKVGGKFCAFFTSIR